ncbi:MliC family protein [Mycobacterium sp. 050134]|uniref:MliC family protein n=1 Tax=Mycobacterium sp. 050134 TaxID=3096111 RepID=UPI002EDBA101
MRLVVACAAALLLGACGSKTASPPPNSGTTSSGTAASANAPATSTSAAAGTFDCARPANPAQQLVCNDPQLTGLDHRVQTAYQQALGRPGADTAGLNSAQGAWTAVRDGCGGAADTRPCLEEAYQTRLVQLAIADPATAAPPVVTYNCPAGSGPLTAQFYNQFDPQTAVLNWKGTQQILFIRPAASGAHYGNRGADFWEHQGDVNVELGGTKFVCHTQ